MLWSKNLTILPKYAFSLNGLLRGKPWFFSVKGFKKRKDFFCGSTWCYLCTICFWFFSFDFRQVTKYCITFCYLILHLVSLVQGYILYNELIFSMPTLGGDKCRIYILVEHTQYKNVNCANLCIFFLHKHSLYLHICM